MLRKFGPAIIFLLAVFLVIEVSYRFYVVGPVALNPIRANSLNTLIRSEFVRLSEYPDVFFELKPNIDGWFKGKRFTTNKFGQADREYSQDKPADTFRVAVVGSSWSMPTGVLQENAWHSVLEEDFAESGRTSIEFINFATELYGLREITGTLRHKVLDWDPDLVIVAVTTITSSFLWTEPDGTEALPPRAYPALDLYSLKAVKSLLNIETDRPADDRARIEPNDAETRIAQLYRSMQEVRAAADIPVVFLFLSYIPLPEATESALRNEAQRLGITPLFGNYLFADAGVDKSEFQVSKFDRHPNSAGHRVIADYVGEQLTELNLLPD